jgi:hypothetical protein
LYWLNWREIEIDQHRIITPHRFLCVVTPYSLVDSAVGSLCIEVFLFLFLFQVIRQDMSSEVREREGNNGVC